MGNDDCWPGRQDGGSRNIWNKPLQFCCRHSSFSSKDGNLLFRRMLLIGMKIGINLKMKLSDAQEMTDASKPRLLRTMTEEAAKAYRLQLGNEFIGGIKQLHLTP